MSAQIIDGKAVAAQVTAEVKNRVEALKAKGVSVGLAVILAGEDPASQVYVRNKIKKCAELGIESRRIDLPADVTMETTARHRRWEHPAPPACRRQPSDPWRRAPGTPSPGRRRR